ncbi:hypothetical protein BZG36_02765 [Bifiguratus adelaidae]|uniref:Galactose oxidase n=1 Tax=Bifiguratus adelaidae TaxID=1938954 RepID=A0A261Y1X4_9FUNG|nr:hypothetical protein BZG36_02765 [Bifiguratus adelaidae]
MSHASGLDEPSSPVSVSSLQHHDHAPESPTLPSWKGRVSTSPNAVNIVRKVMPRSQESKQKPLLTKEVVVSSSNFNAYVKQIPPSLRTKPKQVAPAPAAGMYWSCAHTYGRETPRLLRAHTATLVGELMYVFGGCDAKSCYNTLYTLDLDTLTWSRPKTTGEAPPPCRAHSATLVDRKLFIFGGGDGPNYFNDLYILDTGTCLCLRDMSTCCRSMPEKLIMVGLAETLVWSKPLIQGTPPTPRRAHTTCLYKQRIYIFGGGDGSRALHDVFYLDVSNLAQMSWSKLEPAGRPPISRGYHTSNLVGDKWVIFGGSDGHECFNDVFVLDLALEQWFLVDLDREIPRLSHTATQVGSYLFVVGGHDGTRYSNDILMLNLVTMNWEVRKVYGQAPSPRGYHSSILYDSRLFIFGGYDGRSVFDDVYILDLAASAYLPQITNFAVEV